MIGAPEALARLWGMPETQTLPRDREWVYFLAAQMDPGFIKIGKAQELRWRVLTIQYGCPIGLKLIGAVSAPAGTERVIHAKFKALRHFGEWFSPAPELLAFIESLPKGGPLPAGLAQQWVSETGMPLLPKKRGKAVPGLMDEHEHRQYKSSLYWLGS